ncbi:ATP-grasp domain-containing protein [Deinococcus radiophilus]|uniref:ATP-grasp domain-containing protein n=1 Tax=Deinococcus radiophilus TaxID=32062 RepID=A0A3S0KBE3_9DEIO|nr:ATP-grasp domain-containing protein [Deinococcus radiophilus]RTR26848.1 hypothetical protein EJ104_07575 [Deinococcus radiophilus]UFA51787.1 ATP-grasp domain-containing protein [Deinococcus radiophilus]
MTSPTRVLLNKNFSVTAAQMTALMGAQAAAGDADAPYELWASHSDPANGMLAAASHTLLEPAGLLGDAYADWLLDACVQRGIGVLWAGKEREWLADHQGRFAAQGVQLVVPAERHIQEKLDHKDAFLEDWDPQILPIPRWQRFTTPQEFGAAYAALQGSRRRLCIKPAQGIYASGFRILEDPPSLDGFLGGSLYTMSLAAARELFSAPQFPPMLLMEVLEGPERSVDCVAWEGRLIRAVVRRKFGVGQVIEDRPDLTEAARRIAERYGLSGIFNFQTKDQAGAANMLEINARASGGLRYSMAAGVDFLRLGLDAATGRLDWDALPTVQTGFQVYEDKAVRVVPGLPAWAEAGLHTPSGGRP